MMFRDRRDAGRQLAARLASCRGGDPVVLALPRGGVPIGAEIAKGLDAPLDIVLVRKIGVPFQPELALGAIVDGEAPELLIDDQLMTMLAIPERYVEQQRLRQLKESSDAAACTSRAARRSPSPGARPSSSMTA